LKSLIALDVRLLAKPADKVWQRPPPKKRKSLPNLNVASARTSCILPAKNPAALDGVKSSGSDVGVNAAGSHHATIRERPH
jgi:hypothetical protein